MFLVFIILFCILPHATLSHECPDSEHTDPCSCMKANDDFRRRYGLKIACRNVQNFQVKEVLSNLAEINESIYLDIINVPLANLPPDLLVEINLQELFISRCNVSSVDENAFGAVKETLKYLSLLDNNLIRVPTEALQNLASLEILNLRENKLEVLHAEAFKGLRSLYSLTIAENRIKFVDDRAFVGIGSRFRLLFWYNSNLKTIPSKALFNVKSLTYIDLSDNHIDTLESQEMQATGEPLGHLILSNNNIRHLPARAFLSPMNKLAILSLYTCRIETIDSFAFQGLEDSLRSLGLPSNRLDQVPYEALKNLSTLQGLDLRRNNIQLLRNTDFQSYGKTLTHIFLENNGLSVIEPAAFANLNYLGYLFLSGNKISSLPFETYAPVLHGLKLLEVKDNPLHCDCRISWFRDWMKGNGSTVVSKQDKIICSTPEKFSNVRLEDIPTDQLLCENDSNSSK